MSYCQMRTKGEMYRKKEGRDMEKDFERHTYKAFDATFQCNMVARKKLITSCRALGYGEERLYNLVHMVLVRPYRKKYFLF